jgi:Ca-activated chloride channel family protein
MKATIRMEHSLLAVEMEHTVHAMLDLVAPAAPETGRAPITVALVIDRSGSMAGRALEVVKECAGYLIRRLGPSDQLALVAYDDEVHLLAAPGGMEREDLLDVVEGILPGGGTNLSGGWLKGAETLLSDGRNPLADGPRPVRRIILLTDGRANVGIMEPAALQSMVASIAADGIGTTTIGFGDDFDEDLLTGMADACGGRAYYVDDPDQAPGIFAEELEGLVSLVAQNVSVEIHGSDAVASLGVVNGFPQVAVGGGVQIQLGDALAEERRRVMFELTIPGLQELGVVPVAEAVVRWTSVVDEIAVHCRRIPIVVNAVTTDEAQAAASGGDPEVTEEVLILRASAMADEATRRADRGDFEGARSLLSGAAEELRARAASSAEPDELVEQAGTLETTSTHMSPGAYGARTRKLLQYRSHGSRRRRR